MARSPRWLSGSASASREADLVRIPAVVVEPFPCRVIPCQILRCQASGVVGSAVELVDSMSIYCDWVK